MIFVLSLAVFWESVQTPELTNTEKTGSGLWSAAFEKVKKLQLDIKIDPSIPNHIQRRVLDEQSEPGNGQEIFSTTTPP